jgi:hypothetical protein
MYLNFKTKACKLIDSFKNSTLLVVIKQLRSVSILKIKDKF